MKVRVWATMVLASALLACRDPRKTDAKADADAAHQGAVGAMDSPPPMPTPANASQPPGPAVEVPGLAALVHKPLVALVDDDPWLTVVGSDVPSFVLYEDGLVIYVHHDGPTAAEQRTARIPKQEAADMVRTIVDDGLANWPAHTICSNASDQPTTVLLARDGRLWRRVAVYGRRRSMSNVKALAGFVWTYDRLRAFEAPRARAWKPEQIEIMLGPFDYAKNSIDWPADIPAPKGSVSPPEPGGVYSHYVDGALEERVQELTRSARGGTAVQLGGRKWSISYRRNVPEEAYLYQVGAAVRSHN